jgi:uncharacterized protein DUF397
MTVPSRWRKSSFSGEQTDCVELASGLDAVRDTKNPAVQLPVSHQSLTAFVAALRAADSNR